MDRSEGFYVPYLIFSLEAGLAKNERAVLVALLFLQAKFMFGADKYLTREWFNINNRDFCKMLGMGLDALLKARKNLVERGWIDFQPGYSGRNSQYMILTDRFMNCSLVEKPDSTKNKSLRLSTIGN